MDNVPIHEISQVIQLAVAPVFLLAGIAGFLSVLSHRLSRVVDRTRNVDRSIYEAESENHQVLLRLEAKVLGQRTQVINWAIRLSVGSALIICMVVMSLFIGDVALFQLGTFIAYLFVTAMILVILSLLLLLLEVSISTRNLQHGIEHIIVESGSKTSTNTHKAK
ncbi:MAG: DUF2721 domain-containing protein [Gammaproteobacteria bacterium]|nr:MAG: DUF2721 domain-containing protein [Gammaproteobacteria bacterium]